MISACQHESKCKWKFNFKFFLYSNCLSFHIIVLVKTFPLMHHQLPMYGWYWRRKGDFSSSAPVKIQFRFFFIQIFRFSCCLLVKTFPLIYQLATNVGLISTNLEWFLFIGVRTDRHGFGILTWKHVGTQKFLNRSSKLGVSYWSLYGSPMTGMHNKNNRFSLNMRILPIKKIEKLTNDI